MYTTKFISSENELRQVVELSRLNSVDHITDDIKTAQGFTSWNAIFADNPLHPAI